MLLCHCRCKLFTAVLCSPQHNRRSALFNPAALCVSGDEEDEDDDDLDGPTGKRAAEDDDEEEVRVYSHSASVLQQGTQTVCVRQTAVFTTYMYNQIKISTLTLFGSRQGQTFHRDIVLWIISSSSLLKITHRFEWKEGKNCSRAHAASHVTPYGTLVFSLFTLKT